MTEQNHIKGTGYVDISVESAGGYFRGLWEFRELFIVLAWRDISVRYKQTLLGVAWAAIQPLLSMVIFSVIFGKIAKMPSEGSVPYPLMVFVGLLPWQLVSGSISGAAGSLITNANLIGKVYFPRIIVPASAIAVSLVDFIVTFIILIILMVYFQVALKWQFIFLPFFVFMAIAASLGVGLWLAALNVRYRDVRYVIPFLMQLGLYISPVGFSSSVVPAEWRFIYSINPIVGVIDGFRWSVLGNEAQIYLPGFLCSWLIIAILLWIGVKKFRAMERSFADEI